MAEPKKIRVMISSRSNSLVFGDPKLRLADLRLKLKSRIESEELFGSRLFDPWIHEDARAAEATGDAWEESLKEINRAHIVIVLYNGEAGWAVEAGEIGICHAELMQAVNTAPGKVFLIRLDPLVESEDSAEQQRNLAFQEYVKVQGYFHGLIAASIEEAEKQVTATLREAVAKMTEMGVREARKGRYWSGQALDWSRLDFAARKRAMEAVVTKALLGRSGSRPAKTGVTLPAAGRDILIFCHGVPAAMSVAAAREMVGQPFLRDHLYDDVLGDDLVGPIHLIACHRNVTEAQAIRQLGFPDAIIVSAPFGVYLADEVQKTQLVFIAQCRDETSTRHGVQRLFDWLDQSRELERLSERAESRRNIVRAIATENAE